MGSVFVKFEFLGGYGVYYIPNTHIYIYIYIYIYITFIIKLVILWDVRPCGLVECNNVLVKSSPKLSPTSTRKIGSAVFSETSLCVSQTRRRHI